MLLFAAYTTLGRKPAWVPGRTAVAVGLSAFLNAWGGPGGTGMQKLVAAAPALAARPELRATANLRSIDCLATRLWLDCRVACRFPANVLSGFPSLEGAGGTWFHLNDLQVCAFASCPCVAAAVRERAKHPSTLQKLAR